MNAARFFLRTTASGLRLTGVRAVPHLDEGSIHLDPQLCWAMELREFERVEITNRTRALRFAAHVRFGRPGDALVTRSTAPLMQPGDLLKLSAVAWLPAHREHAALLVSVGDRNRPLEIRRVIARTADLDPVSFPIPPSLEFVSVCPDLRLVEAMD